MRKTLKRVMEIGWSILNLTPHADNCKNYAVAYDTVSAQINKI
jgi:hypothetical protein